MGNLSPTGTSLVLLWGLCHCLSGAFALTGSGCASDKVFCNGTCRPRESFCRLFGGCLPRGFNYGDIPVCEDVLEAECGLKLAMSLENLGCSVGKGFLLLCLVEIDSQFNPCGDGDVFHYSQACDGTEDCTTWEDEAYCDECAMECPTDSGDPCVPNGWICDELTDCSDGQDEHGCVQGVPKHCFFTCRNKVTCLPTTHLEDGHQDCADGEDERPGDVEEALGRRWGSCGYSCASVYGNASCVPDAFSCDGDADCWEEEDEQDCAKGRTDDCPTFFCGIRSSPDFVYCVHSHLICDGYPDCAAGEDEQGCGNADGVSTQASTADGTSTQASTADGASTQASTADGTSTQASTADGTSTQASTADGASTQASTADGTSTQASTADGTSTQASTADGASTQASTADGTSTQASTTPSVGPTAEPTSGQGPDNMWRKLRHLLIFLLIVLNDAGSSFISKDDCKSPEMPTKPKSPVPPRKTLAEAAPPRFPPPHDDDDDCVYVEPDGALYMKPADVLYEMPANSGPMQHTNAKFPDLPDGKTLPKGELNSSPFARRHGGDDCVYVEPDGAQYMKPEDVLYEMPANSHCQNPIDAHNNLHYYQPLTKTTDLPTDGNGYVIVEPKNLEGHY
ncbi:LRP1 [Branchiostoma lanceolatum]|uniref:LRP1 protein n=1 Tax=Branchiostoma lanceolatum TaxID=7740 RepID=A0A8J9VNX4_BRALA|nr:LRP1 [Branchiostoma lanceolatum]